MNEIIEYLKREVKLIDNHIEYCNKVSSDKRQSDYHNKKRDKLLKCISILNDENNLES